MKKWYSAIEGAQFPLIMLFISMVLAAIGNLFTSNNEILNTLLMACRFGSAFLRNFFPLLLIINIVGKANVDSVPVVGSIISYILLNITTMFAGAQNLDSTYYYETLGMEFIDKTVTRTPLATGLIGSAIVIFIINVTYKWSRKRFNYGMMMFINNDTHFLIVSNLLVILAGIGISYAYPFFTANLGKWLHFLSFNSTNPAAMFVYGIAERCLEVLYMPSVIKNTFWTGILGGSWTDVYGNTYLGDIGVWTAQMANNNLIAGYGKYITPYYVINLFIVPSLIIGLYLNVKNKMTRKRLTALVIFAIVISCLSSTLVPLELLLLIEAPILLGFHIVLSSLLYAIFPLYNVYLGTSFSGDVAFALPGNIVEFLKYCLNPSFNETVIFILKVGVIFFVVYQILVIIYYRILAQDFLDGRNGKIERKYFIQSFGGINNIKMCTSGLSTINVVVNDKSKINIDMLLNVTRSYKVTEKFYGYEIEYGPGSVALARQIRKEIKTFEGIMKFHKENG